MLHLRSKKKFFEPCLVSWYLAVADTGMMLAWSENGRKLESNRYNLPCSWFCSVRAMCDCCRCSRQQKVATNGQQRVNKGSTKGHWVKEEQQQNVATGKTLQAVTHFHFFDNSFIIRTLSSQENFHQKTTFIF